MKQTAIAGVASLRHPCVRAGASTWLHRPELSFASLAIANVEGRFGLYRALSQRVRNTCMPAVRS